MVLCCSVIEYTMFHLANVLKYVLVVYLLKEASRVIASPKVRKTKFKIDEFIDRLLASKKFDILAEKIAQKAVERMIDLHPELRLSKEFVSKISDQEKIPYNNITYKTEVHFDETSTPIRNLSLKFRHFIKAKETINHGSTEIIGKIKEIDSFNAQTTVTIERAKVYSDENDKPVNDISDIDLESCLQDETKNKSITKCETRTENDKESSLNQNKTEKEETRTDVSLSAENKKNAELSAENELAYKHETNESYANSPLSYIEGVASDFDRNVRKDRALFSNESNEVKETEIIKPRTKRVHREGNKLYTFQSSSEYDEYHQELNRVEKNRTVFV